MWGAIPLDIRTYEYVPVFKKIYKKKQINKKNIVLILDGYSERVQAKYAI